ncbi:MAG TPA: hypothetical protein VMG98_10060 [Verrucomicrobiae bacterium]|nr:hypothetical protein [Verrucomicrobiae bacterium]
MDSSSEEADFKFESHLRWARFGALLGIVVGLLVGVVALLGAPIPYWLGILTTEIAILCLGGLVALEARRGVPKILGGGLLYVAVWIQFFFMVSLQPAECPDLSSDLATLLFVGPAMIHSTVVELVASAVIAPLFLLYALRGNTRSRMVIVGGALLIVGAFALFWHHAVSSGANGCGIVI